MAAVDSRAEVQAEATHERIADSASAIEQSAGRQVDNAARSTQLAADRTVLAAERTYAAWVRTGMAALAAGIGARALLENVVPAWLALTGSGTLILFSGFCFGAAVWRELRPVYRDPMPTIRRLPPVLLIAVNGVLVLVSLAAMVGVLTT